MQARGAPGPHRRTSGPGVMPHAFGEHHRPAKADGAQHEEVADYRGEGYVSAHGRGMSGHRTGESRNMLPALARDQSFPAPPPP